MLVKLKQLSVPPGQRVLLKDVNWQDFEAILADLGESRNSRIAYENNTLEIMVPLRENESAKVIIADLLKVLMQELEIEFLPLGSTTFKNELM